MRQFKAHPTTIVEKKYCLMIKTAICFSITGLTLPRLERKSMPNYRNSRFDSKNFLLINFKVLCLTFNIYLIVSFIFGRIGSILTKLAENQESMFWYFPLDQILQSRYDLKRNSHIATKADKLQGTISFISSLPFFCFGQFLDLND